MFIWEKKEFDILVLGILDGHGWEVGLVTANCQGSILDFLHDHCNCWVYFILYKCWWLFCDLMCAASSVIAKSSLPPPPHRRTSSCPVTSWQMYGIKTF
jgi:hypothetical protein